MNDSHRETPEARVELRNDVLRIDYDPRTSDTMYNYIWVKRPSTGEWERCHNFGIDVHSCAGGEEINCVGMAMDLKRDERSMVVTYPSPIIRYRQFDDKVGDVDVIRRYPDFARDELSKLVGADASVEFTYTIHPELASFDVSGKALGGKIELVIYIVSALWTDNHALPTHVCFEGFPEFDVRTPEGVYSRSPKIENVAHVIYYRADGNGVPFACLPLSPGPAGVCNYYDNWQCLDDFRLSCYNQQFIAQSPPVTGCNDTGYVARPKEDGTLDGVRVAFFPELGWGRGGMGHVLRERIEAAIEDEYTDAARSWDRRGKNLPPTLTLSTAAPF